MADKKPKKSHYKDAKQTIESVLGEAKPRKADELAKTEGSMLNKIKKAREKRKKMLDEI